MVIAVTVLEFLLAATAIGGTNANHHDESYLRRRQLKSPYPDPEQVVDDYLACSCSDLNLTGDDIANKHITTKFSSRHNGVTHLYYIQTLNGINTTNGVMNFNVDTSGEVVGEVRSSFVSDLKGKARGHRDPTITAEDAIRCALADFGLPSTSSIEQVSGAGGFAQESTFSGDGISQDDVTAKLVYYGLESGDVELAWELKLNTLDQNFGGNIWVKAQSSACNILDKSNWIDALDRYEVFAMPKESPNNGARTIVTNPADPVASPFGWHDTDGVTGAEFTTTRGNNVCAQTDIDGNNANGSNDVGCGEESPPNGGPSLDFAGAVVPLDLTQAPFTYRDAAVVNAFYWNNILHDVLYHYGFTEVSGNFQENNYGKGGFGGDPVSVDVQDGFTNNNAFFKTNPDGQRSWMRLHEYMGSPNRDSAFDAGIIAHEYCHGLSKRLTGGAMDVNCLKGDQQPGEGWSDFCGLFFTAVATDTAITPRGIGPYVKFQPPNGPGMRPFPYSTDMAVNPLTYGDIITAGSGPGTLTIPHGVGHVWAVALWEVYWQLVSKWGFDSNLYTGTGGNNIAMQLVVDGLMIQPCNPTFLEARDAILTADLVNNNGENVCEIWEGFAQRGMGWTATDGGSSYSLSVTEAFDLPPFCPLTSTTTTTTTTSTTTTTTKPFCGNNVVDKKGEKCDGTDLNGETCLSLGFCGGKLGCLNDCSGFDTNKCKPCPVPSVCGNNNIDPGETCDGTDLDSKDCSDFGFCGGSLACQKDCSGFKTGGCTECLTSVVKVAKMGGRQGRLCVPSNDGYEVTVDVKGDYKWFLHHGAYNAKECTRPSFTKRSDKIYRSFCRRINREYHQLRAPMSTSNWLQSECWKRGTCSEVYNQDVDHFLKLTYHKTDVCICPCSCASPDAIRIRNRKRCDCICGCANQDAKRIFNGIKMRRGENLFD